MANRIVHTKDQAVTLGVMDKNLAVMPDLVAVTFTDQNGTPHTVHAHREGPFGNPEAIVQAWEDGTLHTFDTHEAAAQHAEDNGHKEEAERLRALHKPDENAHADQEGGRY